MAKYILVTLTKQQQHKNLTREIPTVIIVFTKAVRPMLYLVDPRYI